MAQPKTLPTLREVRDATKALGITIAAIPREGSGSKDRYTRRASLSTRTWPQGDKGPGWSTIKKQLKTVGYGVFDHFQEGTDDGHEWFYYIEALIDTRD